MSRSTSSALSLSCDRKVSKNSRHHLDRGGVEHLLHERHQRRRHIGAVGQVAGRHEREVGAELAVVLEQRRRGCRTIFATLRDGRIDHPRGPAGQAERSSSARLPVEVGKQRDADDPIAEQLRMLVGQRQDRHPAHRVTDEDDRTARRDGLQDGVQVLPELVDRAVLRRRCGPRRRGCAGRRTPAGQRRRGRDAGSGSESIDSVKPWANTTVTGASGSPSTSTWSGDAVARDARGCPRVCSSPKRLVDERVRLAAGPRRPRGARAASAPATRGTGRTGRQRGKAELACACSRRDPWWYCAGPARRPGSRSRS